MNKKLLAVLAMALVPTVSVAATDITNNAELKFRMNHNQNSGRVDGANTTAWEQRLKWGLTYRAGEKLTGKVQLLHNANWGEDHGEAIMGDRTDDNALLVNQAFVNWMTSNDLSFTLGRQPIDFGDGTIFNNNDWEHEPYAFDGVGVAYDTEFAGINFWGVKLFDAGYASTGVSSPDSDPERNLYVLSIDVKNMPEFLKMLNIHIVKDSANEVTADTTGNSPPGYTGSTTSSRIDSTRFGLTLKGMSGMVDYRLTYSAVSGEVEASGAKTDLASSMIDASVGYSLESFKNSHFELAYHTDTGDKTSTGSKNEGYDSAYYNMHYNAGRMDIQRWGNLTYVKVGWHLEPMADYTAGLDYFQFSQTEDNGGEGDLGTELDLYASRKYDNGLMMTARLGMFTPGDA
mgnify:CR=1 FL=1